ncbi:MAG TPA: DUF4911 domain-containing protein [Syntrophomonadaceae bacterium]|jgi:dissimilatory sulfite reductase (desulfoviridin) alpha/beta subunit|nr:DUF4911 domain-containing protein [Syntrophomonadaceae bacterium]
MKDDIFARVKPDKIDMLTKIVEAYDNLGVVSTLDRNSGQVVVRVTPDTWEDMMKILENLPFPIEIMAAEV